MGAKRNGSVAIALLVVLASCVAVAAMSAPRRNDSLAVSEFLAANRLEAGAVDVEVTGYSYSPVAGSSEPENPIPVLHRQDYTLRVTEPESGLSLSGLHYTESSEGTEDGRGTLINDLEGSLDGDVPAEDYSAVCVLWATGRDVVGLPTVVPVRLPADGGPLYWAVSGRVWMMEDPEVVANGGESPDTGLEDGEEVYLSVSGGKAEYLGSGNYLRPGMGLQDAWNAWEASSRGGGMPIPGWLAASGRRVPAWESARDMVARAEGAAHDGPERYGELVAGTFVGNRDAELDSATAAGDAAISFSAGGHDYVLDWSAGGETISEDGGEPVALANFPGNPEGTARYGGPLGWAEGE